MGSTSDPPTTSIPNSLAAIASVEMPWARINNVGAGVSLALVSVAVVPSCPP